MTTLSVFSKALISLSGLALIGAASMASAFGDVSLPNLEFPTNSVAEAGSASACGAPTCPVGSDVTRSTTSLTTGPVSDGQ